jgi:hypothetical protein
MSDDQGEARGDDALGQIIERARSDPGFFHNLVFDPERAISDEPGLDRATRSRLIGIDPDELVAGLLGITHCGRTCGDISCDNTCGRRTCDVTCASSCSRATCAGSCGQTSFLKAF